MSEPVKRSWRDVTLEEMIKEVKREIALRRIVYVRRVNAQKMRLTEAREFTLRLVAVQKQLERALILERVSNDMVGSATQQVEIVLDDGTFLSTLQAAFKDGPDPSLLWETDQRTARSVHQFLLDRVLEWSGPSGLRNKTEGRQP